MSKRRNRKKSNSPNLPQETLARARREAGLEAEEVEEELEEVEEEVDVAPVNAKPVKATASRKAEARGEDSLPPVQRRKRRRGTTDPTQMSQEEISDRLANPTRTVSTEALAEQYSYVTSDLRSMWLLAGALFVIMIAAARFLGH